MKLITPEEALRYDATVPSAARFRIETSADSPQPLTRCTFRCVGQQRTP